MQVNTPKASTAPACLPHSDAVRQALPEGARRYRWDTCIEVRTSVIHSLPPVNFRWLLVLSAAWSGPFPALLGLEK